MEKARPSTDTERKVGLGARAFFKVCGYSALGFPRPD